MSTPPAPTDWLPLGTLGRPRGLAGAVWFHPHNLDSDALRPGLAVRLTLADGVVRAVRIADLVPQGKGLVARIEGVNDRTGAEALVRAVVELQRKDFPPLAEGEFYHVDLVGMVVVDAAGERVGEVARVAAYPSIDALVVTSPRGELELPMTDSVVHAIDFDARVVTVDLAALAEG